MRVSPQRAIVTLVAFLGIPLMVEFLISSVRHEDFSVVRAALVLGALLVVSLTLLTLHLAAELRLVLESVLLTLGVATTVTGIMVLTSNSRPAVWTAAGIIAAGAAVTLLSALMIYFGQSGADLSFAAGKNSAGEVRHEYEDGDHTTMMVKLASFRAEDEEVATLCRHRLHPDDLHFVGYYVNGKCRFHLDVLDSPDLTRFLRNSDLHERRAAYERTGRQLDWVVARLNQYTRRLDGGTLIRTVLDVREGALFYYWIGEDVYLTGITLLQEKVLVADEKLRRLANELGYLPHHRAPQLRLADRGAARGAGRRTPPRTSSPSREPVTQIEGREIP